MEKYEQFQIVLAEVGKITGLDSYHVIFLSTMILRKIRHPEEGLREITVKTMDTMTTRYGVNPLQNHVEEGLRVAGIEAVHETTNTYGKKGLVTISRAKCLDRLEVALEKAKLPADLEMTGKTVKCVFDYLVKKVRNHMEILAEE